MDDFELEDAARSAFETAMAFGVDLNAFMRLAKTVRAKEREGCAKECEEIPEAGAIECAAAIRAR